MTTVKYQGHKYRLAYVPAPKSIQMSKNKAWRAIGELSLLAETAKDPHIKYVADGLLYDLDRVISRLNLLVEELPTESDWKSIHRTNSFIHMLTLLRADTIKELLDTLIQKLGYLSEDAYKTYEAELPKDFGDLPADYQIEYEDDSFQDVAEFIRELYSAPDLVQVYLKYVAELEAIQAYRQHARRQRRDDGTDVRPLGVEDTEVVWHATTAYPQIIKEGFKLRSELGGSGGLGGSMTVGDSEGISFTGNYEIAEGIAQAFIDMADIMQGDRRYDDFVAFADDLNLPKSTLLNYTDLGRLSPGDVVDNDYRTFDLIRNIMGQASIIGNYYNPVFIAEDGFLKLLKNLQSGDVGIVEATINTAHPGVSYYRSMDEWRVPLSAVVDSGPVGSQR